MDRRRMLSGIAASVSLLSGCSTLIEKFATTETPTTTPNPTATTAGEEAATTLTPTETPTQTQTKLPTATPTESPTSYPIDTPTSTDMTGDGMTSTGGKRLDLSQLTTYTSNEYPFSIKYPIGWTAKPANVSAGVVQFTPMGEVSGILVQAIDSVPVSTTLDKLSKNFITGITAEGNVTILSKRDVTLSYGTPAKLITMEMTYTNPRRTLRATSLATIANGTAYIVTMMVPMKLVTPAIERGMRKIVLSLTVR